MKSRNVKTGNKILLTVAILVYLSLWSPVVFLIVMSFSNNRLGLRWEGFTLRWYAEVFTSHRVANALGTSVIITGIVVVVATVIGTLAAYALYKYKLRGRKPLRLAILLPMIMPYVVMAGALLIFFVKVVGMPLGIISIVLGHITFCFPLVVFVILARMARIDWTLEEASADLGADTLTTWRKVTLPLLAPGIIAAAALIFPWSFNDYTFAYFTGGAGTPTLPVYVFALLRFGDTAVINAIGTFFTIIPIIGLILIISLLKRRAA
jgi:spermidine/putrescine transport system permease protein